MNAEKQARDIEAMKKALMKWEDIKRGAAGYDGQCALCDMYISCKNDLYESCPVSEYTGHTQCRGTSFYDFRRAAEHMDVVLGGEPTEVSIVTSYAAYRHAYDMCILGKAILTWIERGYTN